MSLKMRIFLGASCNMQKEKNRNKKCFFYTQGVYGGGNQRKTSSTLHLFNVTFEDDGIYVCVTHNPLLNISKRSRPAKLTVRGEFFFWLSFSSWISFSQVLLNALKTTSITTNKTKKLYSVLKYSFMEINYGTNKRMWSKSVFYRVRVKWYV